MTNKEISEQLASQLFGSGWPEHRLLSELVAKALFDRVGDCANICDEHEEQMMDKLEALGSRDPTLDSKEAHQFAGMATGAAACSDLIRELNE